MGASGMGFAPQTECKDTGWSGCDWGLLTLPQVGPLTLGAVVSYPGQVSHVF